jgi:hypothetical protein
MVPVYVGYDPREAAVFTVFNQSIIQHSSVPVAIHPLHGPMLGDFDGQQDGTNAFIYSRYLVPELQGYEGWAMFCDGDMIFCEDIAELWNLRDDKYAVMVAKHEYRTNQSRKYIGTPIESRNDDYPRKNWSSVILFNCGHPSNKIVDRKLVAEAGGAYLHRFSWLNDDEVGEIPIEWNWLVGEYDHNPDAKLLHWTHGAPGFQHYARCDGSWEFNAHLLDAINMIGEEPDQMIGRACQRNTDIGSNYQLRNASNGDSRLSRSR